MDTKTKILGITFFAGASLFASCKKDGISVNMEDLTNPVSIMPQPPSQWISFNDSVYYSSGYVGDVMPYYDGTKFHIYYLHDGDANSGYHPIHAFESSDLVHYSYDGKMIPYGPDSAQDRALGTGSVVKVDSTYYFYYTGHNDIYTSEGLQAEEGVMYATSTDLKTWTKHTGFDMLAPAGYDSSNFRDPYVFLNSTTNEYWMLVAAEHSSGQAAIALFTSADPSTGNWSLQGDLYATTTNGGLLECPQLFQIGSEWYLLYSSQDSSNVHYRIASSISGPFQTPAQDVLDGTFFYAAKAASDGTDTYLFGWNYRKDGETDDGSNIWGGNLVTHQLVQNSDGTLSVKLPDAVTNLFSKNKTYIQDSLANASVSGNSYALEANGFADFNLINGQKKITTTIKGLQTGGDAGFIFGYEYPDNDEYYKLRFENGVAYFLKTDGTSASIDCQIPFEFTPGSDISVTIVIDNSTVVVSINDEATLTGRSYSLPNAKWGIYSMQAGVSFNDLQLFSY
ncbi:family 43 glycosylhydrolase [Parafilimonas sp.]|uniref:family 43 glycosylhydrolase n=1 Tax=Parafilimonas sp. TaxID=1969739 RepID=UPI0039E346C1